MLTNYTYVVTSVQNLLSAIVKWAGNFIELRFLIQLDKP